MQMADLNNASDRKKLIWAVLLGLVAILVLWWTFVGFGSSQKPIAKAPQSTTQPGRGNLAPTARTDASSQPANDLSDLQLININFTPPNVPEVRRNIFAFYVPPPKAEPVASVSTPTPTPTPPLLLASIAPSNVYAKTSDFTLEVSGDKFTPELRIYLDNREVQTRYRGPQQLSATVPAAMIGAPGVRQVVVRSPDSRLYTNPLSLSVAAPPTPNYLYIGIIETQHRVGTAILQDRSSKDTLNVQRGDLLSGRFRVTSISEKELVLVDTNLKIKHSIMISEGDRNSNPLARPTPNVSSEVDDEP